MRFTTKDERVQYKRVKEELDQEYFNYIDDIDEELLSSLSWAVIKKDIYKIKYLIKNKPYLINRQDRDGNTPLMIAAKNHYKEAVEIFLDAGAKTDIKNRQGKNAFDRVTDKNFRKWLEKQDQANKNFYTDKKGGFIAGGVFLFIGVLTGLIAR